jgi:hypothetical protein
MPTSHISATLRGLGLHKGEQINDLGVPMKIASLFKVSLRAATIRLIDLETASWSLYNQLSDNKAKSSGGFYCGPLL